MPVKSAPMAAVEMNRDCFSCTQEKTMTGKREGGGGGKGEGESRESGSGGFRDGGEVEKACKRICLALMAAVDVRRE